MDETFFVLKINNHRCNWIRKLINEGVLPEICLIEITDNDNWQSCERKWIKFYKDSVTNGTEGGEGLSNPSVEIREKISNSNKGKTLGKKKPTRTHEHCLAISKSGKGRKLPPLTSEHKQAISVALSGKQRTQETKDKISKARKGKQGKPISEEAKKKISEKMKNRTFSDEHREKISNAKKVDSLSEETRKRMSDSAKLRCANNGGKAIVDNR
jgi:hypothetical protein